MLFLMHRNTSCCALGTSYRTLQYMCQTRAAVFLACNGLLKTSLRGGSREEGNMFYRDYIGIIGKFSHVLY